MELHSSEDICEALVRHIESYGCEVFEKNFVENDKVTCTVWCVIGDNAQDFQRMVHAWMNKKGFKEE